MPADGLSGSPLARHDLPDPLDGRRIDPVRVAGLLLNPGAQRLGRHRSRSRPEGVDVGGVEFGCGRFDQRQRIGHEIGVTVEQRDRVDFEHLGDLGRRR